MNTDFERAKLIQDGYFYTFKYDTITTGYDNNPFVFCLQPDTRNINNVVCLNLHHLPVSKRAEFLVFLDTMYNIKDAGDKRLYAVDAKYVMNVLREFVPAIRYYDRKKINNLYRIKAKDVGKYIEYEGGIIGKDPKTTVMNKYWGEEYGKAVEGTPSEKQEG